MQVTKHKVVGLQYTFRDQDNNVLEAHDSSNPLYYLHGEGLLIGGVEDELEGKQPGDIFEVVIPPERGYGVRDESMVEEVPRETLGDRDIQVGMQLHGSLEQIATVIKVGPETVTIDANDPLAGKTLTVSGKIVDVRDAMQEEVSLGRANKQDDDSLLILVTLRTQKDTE